MNKSHQKKPIAQAAQQAICGSIALGLYGHGGAAFALAVIPTAAIVQAFRGHRPAAGKQ